MSDRGAPLRLHQEDPRAPIGLPSAAARQKTHSELGEGTPSPVRLTQAVEWLGMRFDVPEDWQIVRHGLVPKAGRLILMDRRRERCSLIWTHCSEAPDLERFIHDAKARARGEESPGGFEPFEGDLYWRGFTHVGKTGRVTSVVRWDQDGERLVEFVVITSSQEDNLTSDLLDRLEFVCAPSQARRWCAFDVDATVPEGFRLVALDSRPADVAFTFQVANEKTGRPGRQEIIVRRMGMAQAWHDGDLERLVRRLDPEASIRAVDVAPQAHHEARLVVGREAGPRWRQLVGLRRVQKVLTWECQEENAVYSVLTRSPRSQPLCPTAVSVDCRRAAS